MPVTPNTLLRHAKALLGSATEEVAYRAAASRAYYAAFHTCREVGELVKSVPPPPDKTGSHARLIHTLRNNATGNKALRKEVRKLGGVLKQCRNIRTKADYRTEFDFPSARAKELFGMASRIVKEGAKALKQIKSLPPK